MQIKTAGNGMAKVITPYNAEFVAKVKGIGGRKWNAAERCWEVPESEIDTVRGYMMDIFGETDLPTEGEKVTVKVTFNSDESKRRESITLFGKTLARAWGRDSGAKVGEDVTLISGKVTSGGSVKNWYTEVEEGTVLKVRNVPRAALEQDTDLDVTVEVMETAGIDRAALMAEKEKILARLAEIENLLAQ